MIGFFGLNRAYSARATAETNPLNFVDLNGRDKLSVKVLKLPHVQNYIQTKHTLNFLTLLHAEAECKSKS